MHGFLWHRKLLALHSNLAWLPSVSLQPSCLSPTLPCGEGKAASPVVGCMCSALQVEVAHLRSLVLQSLDDQKKLQQETVRLSAQLQQFCKGTEGMQQVRTHHLGAHPCSGLTTLLCRLWRLCRRKQLLTDVSLRAEWGDWAWCLSLVWAADAGYGSSNRSETKETVSCEDSPVLEGPGIPFYFSWWEGMGSQMSQRVPNGCEE